MNNIHIDKFTSLLTQDKLWLQGNGNLLVKKYASQVSLEMLLLRSILLSTYEKYSQKVQ